MKFPRHGNHCHVYDLNLLPLFEHYQCLPKENWNQKIPHLKLNILIPKFYILLTVHHVMILGK